MVVEKTQQLENKTIFFIYEPTRYGEPDASREEIIPHDSNYRPKLLLVSKKEIENLPNDKYDRKEMQKFKVPKVGTVVFINDFDMDYCSATYRKDAHRTKGPFLLEE